MLYATALALVLLLVSLGDNFNMSGPMADTDYVKRMVGDALAKGCAATMAANPADPVEFLGQWLLQYVRFCFSQRSR